MCMGDVLLGKCCDLIVDVLVMKILVGATVMMNLLSNENLKRLRLISVTMAEELSMDNRHEIGWNMA